ncbi:MAG: peroxiredoxin family protein, partial [Verrucomicrobiae bacterium]|nr:peroxiredoxin family protein [Verrucomicrobiae bacterium]
TQNLNQLGGLLRWMPLTGLTALVAAMSISGVPGFNGFLSKWTLYVGAIQGTPAGRLLPVCAVIGILISAVTLASFMKFFGVSFLGQTSRTVTSAAQEGKRLEVDGLMQAPQLVLAAACVLFGLVPGLAFGLVARALLASQAGYAGVLADALGGAGKVPGMPAALGGSAVFLPLAMLAVLLLLAGLAALLTRSGGASRRRATPWLTGYQTAAEPTRYTAHGLYAEFKRRFRWLGGTPGSPVAKDSEPPKTT